MKERTHLPMFGIGPLYGIVVVGLTLAAFLLRKAPLFAAGGIVLWLRIVLMVLGGLLIAGGIALWVWAVPLGQIDNAIKQDRLCTTGAYAVVRNPIYTAILMACTGWLLIAGNWMFFVLPPLYWLFLTLLLRATEEKWLLERFGAAYTDYCAVTNRCIPWFPKK